MQLPTEIVSYLFRFLDKWKYLPNSHLFFCTLPLQKVIGDKNHVYSYSYENRVNIHLKIKHTKKYYSIDIWQQSTSTICVHGKKRRDVYFSHDLQTWQTDVIYRGNLTYLF